MSVEWRHAIERAPAHSQEIAAVSTYLQAANIVPFPHEIFPFEGIGPSVAGAWKKANDAVTARWWSFVEKYWPESIIGLSRTEPLPEVAMALCGVVKDDFLPDERHPWKGDRARTQLDHIRQEIDFYCYALAQDVFGGVDTATIREALRLAVLTYEILDFRSAYKNTLESISVLQDIIAEPDQATRLYEGYPVKDSVTAFGKTWPISFINAYASEIVNMGPVYYKGEGVQGIEFLPLKYLVYFFKLHLYAYLKGVREARIVNTVFMTVWSIAAVYTAGGVLANTAQGAKLFSWAKSAGSWIYAGIKNVVEIVPEPLKNQLINEGVAWATDQLLPQGQVTPPDIPTGPAWLALLEEHWKLLAVLGGGLWVMTMGGKSE